MNRAISSIVLILAVAPRALHGAFEIKETGARAVALSGAYSALAKDALAPFWNPACVRALEHPEATSFYTRFFLVEDLSYMGLSSVVPTRIGGLGLALSQFGSGGYSEQEIAASHGFKISDRLLAGWSMKGLLLKMDHIGSKVRFGLDLAAQVSLSENLDLAFVIHNSNEPSFGISKEKVPRTFVLGMAFEPMNGVRIASDLVREGSADVQVKSGMEFGLSQNFILRGGLQNNFSRFSGGAGLMHGNVALDYAFVHHIYLPGTHQFNLTYRWGDSDQAFVLERWKPRGRQEKKPVRKRFSFQEKISLSSATAEELDQVEGVGPMTAQKIIDFRAQSGLKSMDDLLMMPGMTKKLFFILEDCCVVKTEAP